MVDYVCVIFSFIVSIRLRDVFIPLLVVSLDFKTNARRYRKTHWFTGAGVNSDMPTRVNSSYGRGGDGVKTKRNKQRYLNMLCKKIGIPETCAVRVKKKLTGTKHTRKKCRKQ